MTLIDVNIESVGYCRNLFYDIEIGKSCSIFSQFAIKPIPIFPITILYANIAHGCAIIQK
jgi:hypothetical protein